ncbi:MAG: Ca2+:H+ antiporter, partial [Chloroflexota bacterium]|nr:Ca2+:H+ antiporter [Chloroflexota bacterium]
MTDPAPAARGSIPIIGGLSPLGRTAFLIVVGLGLVTIVASIVAPGLPPTLVFGLAAVSILGLAWLIGQATERIGAITGPQVGGILNATFGNIAELIIAFFALQA